MKKYFLKFLKTKSITDEQFKELDIVKQTELHLEYIGTLEETLVSKADSKSVTEIKDTIKEMKTKLESSPSQDDVTKLSESVEEISKSIEKLRDTGPESAKVIGIKQAFVTGMQKAMKEKYKKGGQPFEFTVKADNAFNLFANPDADTGFENDEVNVDDNILMSTAIDLGFAETLKRENSILLEITNPIPIRVGDALKIMVKYDENGKPVSLGELAKKSNATYKLKVQKKESGKIAVTWIVSEEYMNRIDIMTAEFLQHFTMLLTDVLEDEIFGDDVGVLDYAVPYAHNAALQFKEANKFDAINAATATMRDAKYKPSHIVLNEIDLATMFGEKASDGHYMLSNGQSIRLIDGGTSLVVGANTLKIVKVSSDIIDAGEFSILDWSKIKFGMSSSPIMRVNPYKYFDDNAVENLLEIAFVAMIAETYPYAVVADTFDNVISQINIPAS